MAQHQGYATSEGAGNPLRGAALAETSESVQPITSSNDPVIVVAVDFSEDSKAALIWAGGYAAQTGSRLVALHVVHDPGEAPGSYRQSDEDLLRPMADVAAKKLESFLQEAAVEHPLCAPLQDAEAALVTGIPATRILEFAESRHARGIVVGSRGRTGLPHLLLGSVSERIAQLSPVPVTIVKVDASDV